MVEIMKVDVKTYDQVLDEANKSQASKSVTVKAMPASEIVFSNGVERKPERPDFSSKDVAVWKRVSSKTGEEFLAITIAFDGGAKKTYYAFKNKEKEASRVV